MRSAVQVVGILSVVMVKPVLHIYLYRSGLEEGQCTGQEVHDQVKQVELSHAASSQGFHSEIESCFLISTIYSLIPSDSTLISSRRSAFPLLFASI